MNRRWKTGLAVLAGLMVLGAVPRLWPFLIIVALVVNKSRRRQGKGSLMEWLLEQLGVAREDQTRGRRASGSYGKARPGAAFHASGRPADPKSRPPSAAEKEQGDAYPYTYLEQKYVSQPHYVPPGKDPWDTPPGKDPWELPAEKPPWEQ